MTTGRWVSGWLVVMSVGLAGVPAGATVRTVADFGDSGASGQLRTLVAASSPAGGDVIRLPPGALVILTGVLALDRNLTIEGSGPAESVIDGGGSGRVLLVQARVTIRGVTVRNGVAPGLGGGGIAVTTGSLILRDVVVSGSLGQTGGGLFVAVGSRAVVENSTLVDNEATFDGGGLDAQGQVDLVNVTVSGNRARRFGGGVHSAGTVSLQNVTITANQADSDAESQPDGDGGGLYWVAGTVSLHNTLIAGNLTGPVGGAPDCSGSVLSLGSNLVQNPSFCNGLLAAADDTGLDPLLVPLAPNGGPTPTHALLTGSPAIGVGHGCPGADQRGVARALGGPCALGAFEPATPAAAFDFDGDGVADVVVGAGRGDEPRVRVLSGVSGTELLSFLAYGSAVLSGVRVAVCDLTGDGVPDIVTAPGQAGPVRAFDGTTGQPLAGPRGGFDPVAGGGRSAGVTVACADVTGDGIPDIVVGVPGSPGAEARVLTFSGVDASPLGVAPVAGLRGAISIAP